MTRKAARGGIQLGFAFEPMKPEPLPELSPLPEPEPEPAEPSRRRRRDPPPARKPLRPPTPAEIAELIARAAREPFDPTRPRTDLRWSHWLARTLEGGLLSPEEAAAEIGLEPEHILAIAAGRARGFQPEWDEVRRDLDRLQEVEVEQDGKRFVLRTPVTGCAGKLFQTLGVALPPNIRDATSKAADTVAESCQL